MHKFGHACWIKKKMRRKCRIWWPKHLSSSEHPESTILFGWFLSSSSTSLDVVVVAASPDTISNSHLQPDLQGIMHYTNGNMPLCLQDKSTFSVLGHCAADGQCQNLGLEGRSQAKAYDNIYPQENQALLKEKYAQWKCGCHKLDGFLEQYRQSSTSNSNWIQFSYDSGYSCKGIPWIPNLHHMHWDGQLVPAFDVHVLIYEPPTFGVHHFSLNAWDSSEQVAMHLKRPMWVDKLHHKKPITDLDAVIRAVNCANAAKVLFENCVVPQLFVDQFPAVSILGNDWLSHLADTQKIVCGVPCMQLVSVTWHLVAAFVASFFTLFYIILQLCHSFLSYGSQSYICKAVEKIFSHTWKIIHIRSCQLLYWPVFLQENGIRSRASVEYAHIAALRKHSMWSSIAFDIVLGNIVGFTLLLNMEAACPWVLDVAHDITNNLLRSGCVWLMGVPAGFKLNTELAGIFGMISLNAIQIWSTLWFFLHFFLRYFIQGLAVSGIILGMTVPAALVKDMIMLATLHVSILHRLLSLLYSLQIQALTALWRLFRGRKWNPLRQRFDSYDYTVKQHVVGSLLFTPLLLLLPTTSVFYIFFTILNTTTSFVCIMIEVTISILHATPYTKIFLWMVRPKRFPSGIWFEIVSDQSTYKLDSPEVGCLNRGVSLQRKMEQESDIRHSTVVSLLRSNISNIGQIILPHYKNVFRRSSGTLSAHGILTGKRLPTSLQTSLPPTMPWLHITFREFWRLCYDSVLSCRTVAVLQSPETMIGSD